MVCASLICLGMCLILASFMVAFDRITNLGIDFSPYRNQISVVQSQMVKEEKDSDGRPEIILVGTITNETDIDWKNIEFDTRFYDKKDDMIDSRCVRNYNFTILSHRDLGFKIGVTTVHPQADYESYRIFIGSAWDDRSRVN